MEFKCHFDELDFTRMIAQGLKLELIKIILRMPEVADIEKVMILKNVLNVKEPKEDGTEVESDTDNDWK